MAKQTGGAGEAVVEAMFACSTSDSWPLVLTGDCESLGKWNPAHGVPMQLETDSGGLRSWKAKASVRRDKATEFKFVKLTDAGPQWESGANRVLDPARGGPRVSETFRS